MKNDIDEQLNEVIRRSEKIKNKKAYNMQAIKTLSVAVLGLAVIILAAVFMPGVITNSVSDETSDYGSLIIATPYLGYVIIGLLAFIFGVVVTLFAVKLKKLDEKRKDI
jgi:fatty acid desaturase